LQVGKNFKIHIHFVLEIGKYRRISRGDWWELSGGMCRVGGVWWVVSGGWCLIELIVSREKE